ncbi:MAG: hydroxyisourate hydrolase [Anaerolineae bacterium]|nr:hydroxyisourate hydrolase [Gemmatimonadaceae bacterium]
MSSISTHVLDTSLGCPAAGVPVNLARANKNGDWESVGLAVTDVDGRVSALLDGSDDLQSGTYRMTFDTSAYFSAKGVRAFYPLVIIAFDVHDTREHYHVPLLLSPYGYSTYRGS